MVEEEIAVFGNTFKFATAFVAEGIPTFVAAAATGRV